MWLLFCSCFVLVFFWKMALNCYYYIVVALLPSYSLCYSTFLSAARAMRIYLSRALAHTPSHYEHILHTCIYTLHYTNKYLSDKVSAKVSKCIFFFLHRDSRTCRPLSIFCCLCYLASCLYFVVCRRTHKIRKKNVLS